MLSGADKVSINTATVKNPELITDLMSIFGKQCIVVAIDAKRNYNIEKDKTVFKDKDGRKFWFEVRIYGEEGTGLDAIKWATEVEQCGAGEILLTSIDADGTENGYDMTKAIVNQCLCLWLPLVAAESHVTCSMHLKRQTLTPLWRIDIPLPKVNS